MPAKAADMLLCVQLLMYRRNCYLHLKRHLVAESKSAFAVCLSYVQINAKIDMFLYSKHRVVNVERIECAFG